MLGSSTNVGSPVVSIPKEGPFRGNPASTESAVALAGVLVGVFGLSVVTVVDTKLAAVTIPGPVTMAFAMVNASPVGLMAAEAG
jgi:hypothetical protein